MGPVGMLRDISDPEGGSVSIGVRLERDELSLLHETLSYAHKRTFSEGEKVRLRGLIGRIEERLLGTADPSPLSPTDPETDVISAAADTYCEALEQPFSAQVSQDKAVRVREVVARFQRGPGFLQRLRRLFGRG